MTCIAMTPCSTALTPLMDACQCDLTLKHGQMDVARVILKPVHSHVELFEESIHGAPRLSAVEHCLERECDIAPHVIDAGNARGNCYIMVKHGQAQRAMPI